MEDKFATRKKVKKIIVFNIYVVSNVFKHIFVHKFKK